MSLILCDIDGCLTKGKNHSLQLHKQAIIKKHIKNRDLVFSLCTGRSQPYVELYCQLLGVKTPCICENGSYLYDPRKDEVIYPSHYSDATYKDLHLLKTTTIPHLLKGVNFSYEAGKEASISINSSIKVEYIYNLLNKEVKERGFLITHSKTAVDIMLGGVDKGMGTDFLIEYADLSKHKIIGIGDSLGDIPFLQKSDIACSPYNSDKEVKKVSHYVSRKNFASGVIDILEKTDLP